MKLSFTDIGSVLLEIWQEKTTRKKLSSKSSALFIKGKIYASNVSSCLKKIKISHIFPKNPAETH